MCVGGLIASALPKMEIEDDLIGKVGDDARRLAADAARNRSEL
jgi:hypothetical protein